MEVNIFDFDFFLPEEGRRKERFLKKRDDAVLALDSPAPRAARLRRALRPAQAAGRQPAALRGYAATGSAIAVGPGR